MPSKKLIIALFLSALLVMSGCRQRNQYLDMLEATPMPVSVVVPEETQPPSEDEAEEYVYTNTNENGYQSLDGTPENQETEEQGASYTDTSSGARNTGGSGTSASYSDVPARSSSSSSSSSSGSSGSSSSSSSEPVFYPNVIGLTEEEALEKLEYCGLDADSVTYEVSYADEGTVLYQSFPTNEEGGSDQPHDIDLIISLGNEQYPMPRSAGVWRTTFIESLPRDARADVVILYDYSLVRLADQGIYTVPGEGTMQSLGDPITFYVSQGMLVEDYVGKEFSDVYADLSQGVAYYRNFVAEYSDTVAEGLVISQSHPAGTVLTSQTSEDALVIVYSIGENGSMFTATPVPWLTDDEENID